MDLLEKELLESAKRELDDVLKTLAPCQLPTAATQPMVFFGPVTIHRFVQRVILKHESRECQPTKGEGRCAKRMRG